MENRKLITKDWLYAIGFAKGIQQHNFTMGHSEKAGFIVYDLYNKVIFYNHCKIPCQIIQYQHELVEMVDYLKTQNPIKNKYAQVLETHSHKKHLRKIKSLLKDDEENG